MRLSGQGCSVLVSVQQQVCVHKKSIANGGRSKTHGLLIFSETRFILPECVIENTKAVSEADLAWVDLFAKGIALPCLHEVASHNIVIISFDDQLLPLTHTCAQFEGLPDVFHGKCSTYPLILVTHRVVSRGEIRVQLNCTPKKSNRRNVARERCLNTRLKACNASRDGVVACSRGVLYFCAVFKDSPSFLRISQAVVFSASRTWLLSFACASVLASKSPFTQFTAFTIKSYRVPIKAIEPSSAAVLLVL